jgi:hypothetical protein
MRRCLFKSLRALLMAMIFSAIVNFLKIEASVEDNQFLYVHVDA